MRHREYREPTSKRQLETLRALVHFVPRSEGPTVNSPVREGGDLDLRILIGPQGRH